VRWSQRKDLDTWILSACNTIVRGEKLTLGEMWEFFENFIKKCVQLVSFLAMTLVTKVHKGRDAAEPGPYVSGGGDSERERERRPVGFLAVAFVGAAALQDTRQDDGAVFCACVRQGQRKRRSERERGRAGQQQRQPI